MFSAARTLVAILTVVPAIIGEILVAPPARNGYIDRIHDNSAVAAICPSERHIMRSERKAQQ